ncbi:hypothetical protein H9635_09980 [Solibacillus sp. A46]|uniref:DUF4304 domain-containing protein n=1 Tax=Solibacillus faecavium TaxID=2762221 RepID=A0ABR8XYU5_9BACL|nr:hypothetical protein [Solibacillus faecavium]MBD8037073.1 hypothetical protein [Solibacillus faecavium]
MKRFTKESLYKVLHSKFNEFLEDSYDKNTFNRWYPVGRYKKTANDSNKPIFVNFSKKETKTSLSIHFELYVAHEYPQDNQDTLLRGLLYNVKDFLYDDFLSDLETWKLDPSLAWEESLESFIKQANKKYR